MLVTLQGKVEFEMGEEGREEDVFGHLLRVAIAATYREHLTGVDLSGFTQHFVEGDTVETGALVPAADLLAQLGTIPGLAARARRARRSARTTCLRARSPRRSSSCSKACT